jgi:hypothetical protein
MDITFQAPQYAPAGGVTAESIGAQAPDCGPKATPVIGPDGEWTCQATQDQGGIGGLSLFLLAGLLLLFITSRGSSKVKGLKGLWGEAKEKGVAALL